MEEDIQNYSPTVMFRGSPYKIELKFSSYNRNIMQQGKQHIFRTLNLLLWIFLLSFSLFGSRFSRSPYFNPIPAWGGGDFLIFPKHS